MIKKIISVLVISGLGIANIAMAEDRTLAETKTTFGWLVAKEKGAVVKLDVASAPGDRQALVMEYQFNDSPWIALVKETNFSLAKTEGVKLNYLGTGAVVNFRVKVYDTKGTAYGFTVANGSTNSGWEELIIPRSAFVYLWGGSGADGMDWDNLNKFEITLDLDVIPGATYTLDKEKLGKLSFTDVMIGNAKGEGLATKSLGVVEKTRGKMLSTGGYLIDALNSPRGWAAVSDQGAKCSLSAHNMIIGKKVTPVLKADFEFGGTGAWNAIVKTTNLDLSSMEMIKFRYMGEGGAHKLIFKLMDSSKRVFGYAIPSATNNKGWKNIAISKDSLTYLYGGSGAAAMDLKNIEKLEFTIEKKDAGNLKGVLFLNGLTYK